MRIAITCNGPGEFAGWARPLVRALLARAPATALSLFFVPDDYATGREAAVARRLFPQIRVFEPREYLRFALRRPLDGAPTAVDLVQYLGGDLFHAVRLHARLGGAAHAYKFSRSGSHSIFSRVYAVDEVNQADLVRARVPPDRIAVVGNLAVDGALAEAAGAFADDDPPFPAGGVLIMPGARRAEIANLLPFFLEMARRLRARRPDVPIAFGLSPFTSDEQISAALARGGDRRLWGTVGTFAHGELRAGDERQGFPVVREAMRFAVRAQVVVTIPGTKCIELAALGVPTVVCVPANAPELATINGPLTYLDRLPLVGAPLKRAVVMGVVARFRYLAQPNIDAGECLMPELHGALMPGYVAGRVTDYLADEVGRARAGAALRALYAAHVGAAERMATAMLETPCFTLKEART